MPVARIRNCYYKILRFLLLQVLIQVLCNGQGRLIHPPSRASMWRYGYRTKPDYNDANVDCGGFDVQWRENQGRCGYCGDRWDIPEPRPHERGGIFSKGILVANFTQGQTVTLTVHVTRRRPRFHTGYFEYRLCPREHVLTLEEEQCFDHILEWRYVIDTGKSKPQFRACADITIHPAKVPTTRKPDDLPDYPVNPIQRDYDLQITLAPQPPPVTFPDIKRITTTPVIEDEDLEQRVNSVDGEEHNAELFEEEVKEVEEKEDNEAEEEENEEMKEEWKEKEKEEEKEKNSSPPSAAPFCLILAIILPFTLRQ